MIYLGLDDTDVEGSPGTNQLARHIVRRIADCFHVRRIMRHQLLDDPRVPYTSKNGCASLLLEARGASSAADLPALVAPMVIDWSPLGSDPGLCVAALVPKAVVDWGQRCQQELVTQDDARRLAHDSGIYLQGLGGTEGGVIGALAAIGLAAGDDDGRVLYLGSSADDFYDVAGPQTIESLHARGIDEVRCAESEMAVTSGSVDVGKRLRPNLRQGRVVLYVNRSSSDEMPDWQAVRKP